MKTVYSRKQGNTENNRKRWSIDRQDIKDMKSFGPKPWVLPQPVLIIGTYNEDGTPNAMNAAWGGQWDAKEIMICMGTHATTENLARMIASRYDQKFVRECLMGFYRQITAAH